jgi:acyl-CoA dehydrogenase
VLAVFAEIRWDMTGAEWDVVGLSEEQRDIQQLCRDFAKNEIRPIAAEVDEADGEMPWELWWKAGKLGLTSFMLPEEYGGGGLTDTVTQCIVQEELCHGCAGLGNLITSGGFYAAPILEVGTGRQRSEWLTPIGGERPVLTTLALTEPGAGSDAAAIVTRAVGSGDTYRLSGQKTWASNAGLAELYVVYATINPGAGARGVTAFLVRKDDPGVRFGQLMRRMGQRAIQSREIFLDNVELPRERLLGEEGKAFASLMRTFDHSRIVLAAAATGIARAALDYALQYAGERSSFGKTIVQHQAVGFRLADMATRIDAARLLTWRAAKLYDAGVPVAKEAAMAKLSASETAMWCTWAAVQTLGGWGYSREFPVEKWMRDAKLEEIEEGTSDIQRLVISRRLARG